MLHDCFTDLFHSGIHFSHIESAPYPKDIALSVVWNPRGISIVVLGVCKGRIPSEPTLEWSECYESTNSASSGTKPSIRTVAEMIPKGRSTKFSWSRPNDENPVWLHWKCNKFIFICDSIILWLERRCKIFFFSEHFDPNRVDGRLQMLMPIFYARIYYSVLSRIWVTREMNFAALNFALSLPQDGHPALIWNWGC